MRRRTVTLAILTALAAACNREPVSPSAAARSSETKPAKAPPAAPVAPRSMVRSTPEKCAGDGSYEQALDCFRIASELRFSIDDGEGEMKRPRPGQERLELHLRKGTDRGVWVAEVKPNGVVWNRDGKHVNDVPQELATLFQRVTLFPDPQKKEGTPQLAAREADTNRYEFTDVNSGRHYTVWVSQTDGRIVKVAIDRETISFS